MLEYLKPPDGEPIPERNPHHDRFAGMVCDLNQNRSGEFLEWMMKTQTKSGEIKVSGQPFAHLEEENGRKMLVFSNPFDKIYNCKKTEK